MLYDVAAAAAPTTPDALKREYDALFQGRIAAVGPDTAAAETGIDRDRIAAIATDGVTTDPGASQGVSLSLDEAAALCALDPEAPDRETIATAARDGLLLGMTTAVLDVDTLGAELDGDLEAKAIQQKIEGRRPMTIAEFVLLFVTIEGTKG